MTDAPESPSPPEPPQWPIVRRLGALVLTVVIGFFIVWWTAIYLIQDRLLYQHKGLSVAAADAGVSGRFEQLERVLPDGQVVVAWFAAAPAPGSGGDSGGGRAPVLVYCHGGGQTIDQLGHIVDGYTKLGLHVLLPEYRGFGRSGGQPSQKAICDDLVWFCDELAKRPDVDVSRAVFHGQGVGGAIAADLAKYRQPALLILESTFRSGAALFHEFSAPGFLLRNPYPTDKVLATLDIPVVIFHGRHDRFAPIDHARMLDRIAPRSKLIPYDDSDPQFPGVTFFDQYWNGMHRTLIDAGVLKEPKPPAVQPSAQ